jgi:exosortase H (IPTLxxWG-CTERM-specific)
MVKFLVIFLGLLGVLFGLQLTPWGQAYFVEPWTAGLAKFCQWLVLLFDQNVVATGKVLRSTTNGFAVSIEAGCNGVEATIVLLAAIAAFPAPWAYKALGVVLGFIAVQGLNVIRVITLFYLGQWNMKVFEWAHLYVWQGLIMLDVLVVFLIWIQKAPRSPAPTDDSDPPRPRLPQTAGA